MASSIIHTYIPYVTGFLQIICFEFEAPLTTKQSLLHLVTVLRVVYEVF
jgi:hypothetical protein